MSFIDQQFDEVAQLLKNLIRY